MDLTKFNYETLAEFNRIADHRVIILVTDLSEEEYYKDLGSTLGNVHKKCAHLVSLTDYFIHVLDETLETPDKWPDYSHLSRTELLVKWQTDLDRLVELFKQKQGTHDVTFIGGMKATLDLEHIYFDAVDHSSYHRGQLMTYFRLLGKPTVNTDYLIWWYKTHKKE